jgi:hypothetical protein
MYSHIVVISRLLYDITKISLPYYLHGNYSTLFTFTHLIGNLHHYFISATLSLASLFLTLTQLAITLPLLSMLTICRIAARLTFNRYLCYNMDTLLRIIGIFVIYPIICITLPLPIMLCCYSNSLALTSSTISIILCLITSILLLNWIVQVS